MLVSNTYRNQIRSYEGTNKNASGQHVAYNKDGRWTIGFGCTFYENGTAVKQGDVITEARANSLYNYVLNLFASQVSSLLSRTLKQNQFDALVSLAYNIGIDAFRNSTILRKANLNPNDATIEAEFNRWIYSQGVISKGLVNRRAKEAAYYSGQSLDAISPTNSGLVFLAILFLTILYFRKNEEIEK